MIILLLLAACDSDRVNSNADWTPVIEEHGGAEMVRVPPGCFTMGHDAGRRDERPEHEVCFDEPFWIDRYEVTNTLFGSEGAFPGANRPRENLTWYEARHFCADRGMRLPSEAEWEYAARGPDSLIYPWGNEMDETMLVFDRNNNTQSVDVGTYPEGASWVGAMDMAGNVWEWTNSVYAAYPYDPDDGRETLDNVDGTRVYRGGVASYIDFGVSAAKRFRADPEHRDWFIGFRCVKDDDA